MSDKEQKQEQNKPPPPPAPPNILNQVVIAVIGLILIISPVILLSGSNWVATQLGRILSGEPVLNAVGTKLGGATSAGPEVGNTNPLELPPVDLGELFRFDVNPDWLVTRWPRVTASLADIRFQGYRVPVVTGVAEDDLAGTVTYYFDASQQVKRITFEGTTGNPNRLIAFLTTYYGFAYRPTNNPAVYLYTTPEEGSRGGTHSYLWIRPAPVLEAGKRYNRFELSLVLERPDER